MQTVKMHHAQMSKYAYNFTYMLACAARGECTQDGMQQKRNVYKMSIHALVSTQKNAPFLECNLLVLNDNQCTQNALNAHECCREEITPHSGKK